MPLLFHLVYYNNKPSETKAASRWLFTYTILNCFFTAAMVA